MENKSYNNVFNLEFYHSFFTDGKMNNIVCMPSLETKMVMLKYGFIKLNSSNGMEFYTKAKTSKYTKLRYVRDVAGVSCFEFYVTNYDPFFYNYTEGPINWAGEYIYSNDSLMKEERTFVLKAKRSKEKNTESFAKVTIYIDSLLSIEESKPITYRIEYQSRSTQWRYYIINKSNVSLKNPKVTSKSGIEFEEPMVENLINGESALMFSSGSQLFPFHEVPIHQFKLINTYADKHEQVTRNASVIEVFRGLPVPVPKEITIYKNKGKDELSSPMYVYI